MSADLPAPASAGLRSRDMLGPLEPNSSPLSAPAPPPPPRVSSMVSDELNPCSTTSVEYLSWPSLSVHLRVCNAPSRYTFKLFFRYCSTILHKPSLKITTRCHSVFSLRSPVVLSRQDSDVAIRKLAIGRPSWVRRISGSAPGCRSKT